MLKTERNSRNMEKETRQLSIKLQSAVQLAIIVPMQSSNMANGGSRWTMGRNSLSVMQLVARQSMVSTLSGG